MGISFWIVPSSPARETLQDVMATRPVSEDSSTAPNSYPAFEPHVTLATITKETTPSPQELQSAIPVNQAPIQVNFQNITIGSHYFRSVYIEVVPSAELLGLHKRVHESLGLEPKTPAFPHLSLCYIHDRDAESGERVRFKEALEDRGKSRLDGTGGTSVRIDEGENWVSGFKGVEIWIVECEGLVENWKVLQKISLVQ